MYFCSGSSAAGKSFLSIDSLACWSNSARESSLGSERDLAAALGGDGGGDCASREAAVQPIIARNIAAGKQLATELDARRIIRPCGAWPASVRLGCHSSFYG